MDKIKELFIQNPEKEYYVREISRLVGKSPTTISKKLKELTKKKFLIFRNELNHSLYKSNNEHEEYKQEKIFYNLNRLKDRESDPNNLPLHPYQLDVWEAFSDSGEIKSITDFQILNRVASAYSIIKIERFIEQNCYLATKGAFAFSGSERAINLLLKDARRFDKQLRENVEYTINEIDKELRQK